MYFAHSIELAWSFLVFVGATIVLPTLVTSPRGTLFGRMVRGSLNASAFWVGAALLLGLLKCFNALTIISLGGVILLLARNRAAGTSFRAVAEALPDWAISAAPALLRVPYWVSEHMSSVPTLRENRWLVRKAQMLGRLPGSSLLFLSILIAVITFAISMQAFHLSGTRLSYSDEYLALLRARQLILNVDVASRPLVFPSLVSATALLSSVDPLPMTQILSALVPILLTMAVGRLTFLLTRSFVASSAAMYCQGVASLGQAGVAGASLLFGTESPLAKSMVGLQSSNIDAQSALLFLFLWMNVLVEARTKGSIGIKASTVACALILACSSVLLLLIMPFVGLACVSRRPKLLLCSATGVLIVASIAWMALKPSPEPEVFQYLPSAFCLLLGIAVYTVEVALVSLAGLPARAVVAAICICVAAKWLPPQPATKQHLEYESVASNASAIAEQFPHQRWIIAAPVEQLAEVYSLGSFEDLASLVNAATHDDLSPALSFGSNYEDLFIFVEKLPFSVFEGEPSTVEYSILVDSTYRYYRSPAGRASLEMKAMRLCEGYRRTHRNMSVFFEDDNVRIYRVHFGSPTSR